MSAAHSGDFSKVHGEIYSKCPSAVVGLENVVVIETPDAVLVAHKHVAQNVKKIVGRLLVDRNEHGTHRKVHRPWGTYEGIDAGERFQVERIVVKPGASLSLQLHHHRAEHWIVVRGTALVTRGDETFSLTENQSAYIPLGTKLRLKNPGKFRWSWLRCSPAPTLERTALSDSTMFTAGRITD